MAVYASGDVIMLKPIRIPSEDDFEQLLDEAQEWASHQSKLWNNDKVKSLLYLNKCGWHL